jgi:F-box interacting protein
MAFFSASAGRHPPRDEAEFVVCNPATEKWVVLPDTDSIPLYYLFGFDPAISPHFHVFEIINGDEDYGYIDGVNIYSSETGTWSYKGNGWGDELQLVKSRDVFLNGMMHLLTYDFKILTVDTEGKKWRTIPLLETMCVSCMCRGPIAFLGQSHGLLHYINMRCPDASKLSVWILENYDSGEWIFKYSISTSHIFGEKNLRFEKDYALIAIHPECNLVYFVWQCEDKLMSYDMERGKVCVICDIEEHLYDPFVPYLPYVPFLSDSLADQG